MQDLLFDILGIILFICAIVVVRYQRRHEKTRTPSGSYVNGWWFSMDTYKDFRMYYIAFLLVMLGIISISSY